MVQITQEKVKHLLKAVDVREASGPDDVSPQVLHHGLRELAEHLCLGKNVDLRVVPVHKKKSRSHSANYKPVCGWQNLR
ncbi:hypothetical protein E2C01_089451 [Portunus trituberculatus]|uniref:Uncharacterized protein n=1 Tax=Portunus trituberculatus TaxID=210409 RepID=A0A5B7JH89_PORTR|nr:hypothetical protein [Portunus trituberculatus]